jgi:benzoate/toluate 1,2-dioxygenase subunit alpha
MLYNPDMDWRILSALIDDHTEAGRFSVDRRVFTDQAIFDLEMQQIFEGGWVFLAHASQVPNAHDYVTTTIGRTPVVVMRDGEGTLGAFVNACAHKGARICHLRTGNGKFHVCRYHSWTYDSGGKNTAVKGLKEGGYSPEFLKIDRNLQRLAAFAEYRGFLFGSLVPTMALEDYLGEARHLIDITVEQGDGELELVPGEVIFTFAANWKLQLENCADAYHFTSTHPSYLRITEKRARENRTDSVKAVWENDRSWIEANEGVAAGSFAFAHGHVLNWGQMSMSPASPLFERAPALAEKYGQQRLNWMANIRNLTVFPNLQIADNASSQLRIMRPIAPDLTEMRTFCFAPKNESAEARRMRIRNYEDFFNPSGMATPDDTVSYEDCQAGHNAKQPRPLLGYARGMMVSQSGANAAAADLGILPDRSTAGPSLLCDETLFHSYYRAWLERMTAGYSQ